MEIAWLTIPKIIVAVVIGIILAICIANPVQYMPQPAHSTTIVTPVPTPQPVYIKPTEVSIVEPTPTLIPMNEITQYLLPFPLWVLILIIIFMIVLMSIVRGEHSGVFLIFLPMCLLVFSMLGWIDFGIYWTLLLMVVIGFGLMFHIARRMPIDFYG